jgi:hypothetical protein
VVAGVLSGHVGVRYVNDPGTHPVDPGVLVDPAVVTGYLPDRTASGSDAEELAAPIGIRPRGVPARLGHDRGAVVADRDVNRPTATIAVAKRMAAKRVVTER